MKDNHLSPMILRDYRLRRLVPAETLAVSDHLADCPLCREALAHFPMSASTEVRDLAEMDAEPLEPVRYEELAAWVDGSLDEADRELVAARLAASPRAAAELADLQRFHDELAAQAGKVYGPTENSDLVPNLGRIITPDPSVWRRRSLSRAVFAVAALLTVSAAGWWVISSRNATDDNSRALITDTRGRQADLRALPTDLREAVERTLQDGHLPAPVTAPDLRPDAGTLAGSPSPATAGFHPISPVGCVVRERRPTLRWTPRPDATGYVVILDQLGDEVPPASASPELPATQTTWTPPEPLVAGAVYAWQIEARRGTEVLDRAPQPPAAEARFQILDDARRAELDAIEKQYSGYPLVVAVALARVGLNDEARGELAKLSPAHPRSLLLQRLRQGSTEPQAQSPSPTRTNGAQ